ncbi:uncharacterized protein ASPGLDRAFT_1427475 [Aspergillus glaucus CBS 516.65]|uniref:Uncharacterized protein n=1 Tax=Aspergillus glaucus CBS 516.65 TaxID=1160497 RepID=A0A1L9VMR5_ASPGL|nr:hypothetical protein ASPGLDRAFT_1427475 [Aspergillus glaucus CBS 516.65]OJJ85191.1 hypothetical protein ASPGLDRAFT_1427475 [Aspergillus glaucus CBS 516.65]
MLTIQTRSRPFAAHANVLGTPRQQGLLFIFAILVTQDRCGQEETFLSGWALLFCAVVAEHSCVAVFPDVGYTQSSIFSLTSCIQYLYTDIQKTQERGLTCKRPKTESHPSVCRRHVLSWWYWRRDKGRITSCYNLVS